MKPPLSNAPPPAIAADDWTPIEPFGPTRSFVSGDPVGGRLRVAYFQRGRDGALMGRVWFGPGAQGPPGIAHGGSTAAVLDEAMGAAAWLAGHRALAARLTVDFRQELPLGTDATLEAWVSQVEGRKVITRARLVGEDGQPFAEAEGLFIMLPPEKVAELLERRGGGSLTRLSELANLARQSSEPKTTSD